MRVIIIKTTCKYCGIVNKPHKCPRVKEKWTRDNQRVDKKIYRGTMWVRTRENVLHMYNYVCLWSLYVEGLIVSANTVHHIVELLEDESLAYEISNLIPLNEASHRTIHELYKKDKRKIQSLLRQMKKDYENNDKTMGKYKGCV